MKPEHTGWSSIVRTIAGLAVAMLVHTAGATPLTLTGQLTNAGASYTIDQLRGLGSQTVTVGGDTFVGVPLWTLFGGTSSGTSNIMTSGGGNNPILRNYVVAYGDHGVSLISAGEINPLFGGTVPYVVAYERNGVVLDEPTLVVSRDPTGTRDVENLTTLVVGGVARPPVGAGGVSSELTLSGVARPAAYDSSGLQSLPASTAQNVTFLSGTTPNGPHDYTGVGFWDLLVSAGIQDVLTSYVLATGSDGFQVLYSLAELNPAFGAPMDLIAYLVDGSSLGSAGFARVVVPGDVRGGRYVSNLVAIQVATLDEPSALLLLGAVLIAATIGRNRRIVRTA